MAENDNDGQITEDDWAAAMMEQSATENGADAEARRVAAARAGPPAAASPRGL